MQITSLPRPFFKLYRYAEPQLRREAQAKRHRQFTDKWQAHKREGLSDDATARLCGFSRATYYRHLAACKNILEGKFIPKSKARLNQNKPKYTEKHRQLILQIRRENPTYGKEKIAIILKRDFGVSLSVSSTGRIIKRLKDEGKITKSRSAWPNRRHRNFAKTYAKPWKFKDYNDLTLGELVQIDHMSVTKNNLSVKHFQAWDRKSKFVHANIFSNAKSLSAKKFLLDLVQVAPFPIKSIQVDGGSEFMAEFENACAELKIPLFVLPPKRPSYNGGVERANRTFREEFYRNANIIADSIGELRANLNSAIRKYNSFRPHANLKGLTPFEYINEARSNESHCG